MGIRPPSDLVLDVASAADPAKLRAAMEAVAGAAAVAAQQNGANIASTLPLKTASVVDKRASKPEAMEKLEAFFLQTVVQDILPKDAESVFGSGTAGSVWKSFMAEHIAAELAESTKFGIAERLAGNHFTSAPQPLSMTSNGVAGTNEPATGKNLPFLRDQPADGPAADILSAGGIKPRRS